MPGVMRSTRLVSPSTGTPPPRSGHPKPPKRAPILKVRLSQETPTGAGILLMIRTPTFAGSKLVATLHTTLDVTLADVRMQVVRLALSKGKGDTGGATSGRMLPTPPPVNLPAPHIEAILGARLHPFDLTAPFRFVRAGGCRVVRTTAEHNVRLLDVLPILPPYGEPTQPFFKFAPTPMRIVRKHPRLMVSQPEELDAITHGLCEAIACVFVAQGDFGEQHEEKVLVERLAMQGAGYGRQLTAKHLSNIINRWNANVTDFLGRTVLHEAAQEGSIQLVAFLVELPYVRIDETDARGETALALAAREGHLDVVVALLDHGAKPVLQSHTGSTPLHNALEGRHDAIVDVISRSLSQRGMVATDLGILRDQYGRNPLELFALLSPSLPQLCREGNLPALQALHRHFLFELSSIRAVGGSGETVLHEAAEAGHIGIVNYLLEEMRVPTSAAKGGALVDFCQRTPIHMAALRGHTNCVLRLVKAGIDPNAVDTSNRTALHNALYREHWETADALMAVPGIRLNQIDSLGFSPLHIAAGKGNAPLVEQMLLRGAEVDARLTVKISMTQRTPAEEARTPPPASDRFAFYRYRRTICASYTGGPRRRKPPPKGTFQSTQSEFYAISPLWSAAHCPTKDRATICAALLSHGAGRSKFDTPAYLQSIFEHLLQVHELEIAAKMAGIISWDLQRESAVLSKFCEEKDAVVIRWLIEHRIGGRAVPTPDEASVAVHCAPLVSCCKLGYAAGVSYLLSAGMLTNISGVTPAPLLAAVEHNHSEVVHLLVSAMPPQSPALPAAVFLAASRGHDVILKGLLGCHVNPNATNSDGTPALWAALHNAPVGLRTVSTAAFERCAIALAKYGASVTEGSIHPLEFLHLAASKSFWDSAMHIVDALASLPRSILDTVLSTALPPPAQPFVTITPHAATVPEPDYRDSTKKKRKPLYTPSKLPFQRFVCLRPSPTVPLHRWKHRDVFSFAAQEGKTDLLLKLLLDLGMQPWKGKDLKGFTATDYAVQNKHYESTIALVCAGVLPGHFEAIGDVATLGSAEGKLYRLLRCCRALAHMQKVKPDDDPIRIVLKLLLRISARGDAELLKDVLEGTIQYCEARGVQLSPGWGIPLLNRSFEGGHRSILKYLMTQPRSVLNTIPQGAASPLCYALAHELFDVIPSLLDAGVPPFLPSPLPRTVSRKLYKQIRLPVDEAVVPLFLACHSLQPSVVSSLLSRNDHPLAPTVSGIGDDFIGAALRSCPYTPTNHQCSNVTRIVNLLLEAGAPVATVDSVRVAAAKGLNSVVEMLLRKFPRKEILEASGILGELAIHGSTEVLQKLLFECDEFGEFHSVPELAWSRYKYPSPVSLAIQHGHFSTAAVLLASGAPLRVFSSKQLAPPARMTPSLIHDLIRMETPHNAHVLHEAVLRGQTKLLSELLKNAPFDVDVKTSAGFTPLFLAVLSGNMEMAAELVAKGAELGDNGSALHFALFNEAIPRTLTSAPAKLRFPGWWSLCRTPTSVNQPFNLLDCSHTEMQVFLARGLAKYLFLDANRLIVFQWTPLTLAILLGQEETARALLALGANPFTFDTEIAAVESSTARRRRMFPLTMATGGAPKRTPRPALSSEPSHIHKIVSLKRCRINALDLAFAKLGMSVKSEEAATWVSLVQSLLGQRGFDLHNIGTYLLIAMLRGEKELIGTLLDEASRIAKRRVGAPDADRFIGALPNDPPLLVAPIIRQYRHVLHSAVRTADRATLIHLLRHCKRGDVEETLDIAGRTVAYHAVASGNTSAVEVLISLQVPFDTICSNKNRLTPLMVAARFGHLPVVTLLLKKSSLNAQDKFGNTALMHAASMGHKEIVELLVSVQCDTTVVNQQGLTALLLAAARGHEAIALPLLQYWTRLADITTPRTTVLHCAARGGCTALTQYVVQSYPNSPVLGRDAEGHTPVYLAYAFGNVSVLRILLSALQTRNERPPNPLNERIVNNDSTLRCYGWLRDCLELAHSINTKESKRNFVLRLGELVCAPQVKSRKTCKSLLLWHVKNNNVLGIRVAADHSIVDDCCALHEAAKCGLLDILKMLITLEMSDVEVRDSRGRTALDVALNYDQDQCAAYLVQQMKISIESILRVNQFDQNYFHLAASTRCLSFVAQLLELSRKIPDEEAGAKMSEALQKADAFGNTPFDYSLMFGCAGMSLCLAYAMQLVGKNREAAPVIPISIDFLSGLHSLSPALRVLLFDIFRIREAMTVAGFGPPRRGRARPGNRLSFADTRLIGIERLKQDPFVASRRSELFTVDNERSCFKDIISTLTLGIHVRFKFDSIRHLSQDDQVMVLQHLASSVLIGRYTSMDGLSTPISSIELQLGKSKIDVGVMIEGNNAVEKFFVSEGVFHTADVDAAIQEHFEVETNALKQEADVTMKRLTEALRTLPHPALRNSKIIVNWGPLAGRHAPPKTHSRARDEYRTNLKEALTVLLGDRCLGAVDRAVIAVLNEALSGVVETHLKAVVGTTTVSSWNLVFQYFNDLQEVPTEPGANQRDIIVPFCPTGGANLVSRIAPLRTMVERDLTMVKIHLLRDEFLQQWPELKFKLEIEGAPLETLPIPVLRESLSHLTDSLRCLMNWPQKRRRNAPSKSLAAFTVESIVSRSLAAVKALMLLFSPKRLYSSRRVGSRVMISFTDEAGPSEYELYESLRGDTVLAEIEKLKEQLPSLLSDMAQRLHTYLPGAQLTIDMNTIVSQSDLEDVLAALSLLMKDRSRHVIQAVIQGVSVGWDSKLGTVIRKHVHELQIALANGRTSSIVLHSGGKLVYHVCLLTLQRTGTLRGLLSARDAASQLLIQMQLVDKTFVKMIDRTKAFACWCQVSGRHTRRVVAGDPHCRITITARNLFNRRCKTGGEDFSVRGISSARVLDLKNGLYRVHFGAPTTAGSIVLHLSLYAQPLPRSPLEIEVLPADCHAPSTIVASSFNTLVQNRRSFIVLQVRDAYGNPLRKSPGEGFRIEGTSTGRSTEGIQFERFTDNGNGTFNVYFTPSRGYKKANVQIRVSYLSLSHILTHTVEVLTPDEFEQFLKLRSGNSTATAAEKKREVDCFFRRKIRRRYRDRCRREELALEDSKNRIFPKRTPTSYPQFLRINSARKHRRALKNRWKS